jgi:hypothetical protein
MDQSEWISKRALKPATIPFRAAAAVKKKLGDDYFENLEFNENKTYQVRIEDIEKSE